MEPKNGLYPFHCKLLFTPELNLCCQHVSLGWAAPTRYQSIQEDSNLSKEQLAHTVPWT